MENEKTAAFLPPFSTVYLTAGVEALLSVALFGCPYILTLFFLTLTAFTRFIFHSRMREPFPLS